jgi:uncharacterized protein with beta-barrel porin domain
MSMGADNRRRQAPRGLALGLAALGLIGAGALAQPARAQVNVAQITATFNNGVETLSGEGPVYTSISGSRNLVFAQPNVTTDQATDAVTQLIGRLNNGTPLYNQSFDALFGSPTVQAGVIAADQAITHAGGPGVILMAPILAASSTATNSISTSVYTFAGFNSSTQITTTFGPASLDASGGAGTIVNPGQANPLQGQLTLCSNLLTSANIGTVLPGKPSCSPNPNSGTLAITPGLTDINVETTSTYTIDTATTVTDTTTTTDVYDIDGSSVVAVGTIHAAVPEAGFDAAERFSRRLLDAGLDGSWSSPPMGVALAANGPLRQIALGGALPNPAPFSPWHAWAEPYGYVAHTGSSGSFPGDTRSGGGIDGGIGVDFAGGFRIGAAFDVGGTSIAENSVGESASVQLGQVGLYGGWRSGPLFATIAGTYGWGSAATEVTPAGLGATTSADYGLWMASASAETGYDIAMGRFTLTPSLGAAYFHVDTGAFTETGSPLALTGASDGYDRFKGWLGLKGATTLAIGAGMLDLEAYGRAVAWGGDRQIDLPVSFVGSTTMLEIDGGRTGVFGAELGAGIAYRLAPDAKLYAAYEAELSDRFTAQTGSAGIKIAF